MFIEYFKFKDQPFGATPDPRFLLRSNSHREALASLYCGFLGNRGFTVLLGEPGMGKTTLLMEFLAHARERARTAYVFNTLCEPMDLMTYILRDLGVTPAQTMVEMHQQLNHVLVDEARMGRRFVLVIDEAQNLSNSALETVRLLTNFETSQSKLMHVVLADQPELGDKLSRSEAAQLRQRVSTVYRLKRFNDEEVNTYIEHRLRLAGYTGRNLFSQDAVERIAHASIGIPRIINTLCFNSLCLCRTYQAKRVEGYMVDEAVADLNLLLTPPEAAIANEQATILPAKTSVEPHAAPLLHNRRTLSVASVAFALCTVLFGMLAFKRLDKRPVAGSEMNSDHRTADVVEIPIASGASLESMAREHLAKVDAAFLQNIRKINSGISNPNRIQSGAILQLPKSGAAGH